MKICLACELDNPTDNDYCMKCQEKSEYRCKDCTCALMQDEDLCSYCKEHPSKQTFKCVSCGNRIPKKQSREQFILRGNWCNKCLDEVAKKMRYKIVAQTEHEVLNW